MKLESDENKFSSTYVSRQTKERKNCMRNWIFMNSMNEWREKDENENVSSHAG